MHSETAYSPSFRGGFCTMNYLLLASKRAALRGEARAEQRPCLLLVGVNCYPDRGRCARKRRSPVQRRFTSPVCEGIASDIGK